MYDAKQKKEIKEKIVNEIANNLRGRVLACDAVGCSYDLFKKYYDEDAEFAEAIKKAEQDFETKGKSVAMASVFKAMPNQWQAAAWWLERKHDEFVKREKQELYGKDGKDLTFKWINGDTDSLQTKTNIQPSDT